jgi:hypothetical protein
LAFGVHIPYSLLYEPENPERWDSVLPAAIVTGCVVLYYTRVRLEEAAESECGPVCVGAVRIGAGILLAAMLWSSAQTVRAAVIEHRGFKNDKATRELSTVLDYLRRTADVSARHVVLCSRCMTKADLQVRLTYHYPALTVITLDEGLQPLYCSHDLQAREGLPQQRLPSMTFGTNTQFSAVGEVYESLRAQAPDFLRTHAVVRIPD